MSDKPSQNDFQDLFVSKKIYNLVTRLEHSASNYEWNHNRMTRADQKRIAYLVESLRRLETMLFKAHESYINQISETDLEHFVKSVKLAERDMSPEAYQLMSDELDKEDQIGKLIFDDGQI